MSNPYPPEYDNTPPCEICGKDPAECECPICPKCHEQGNPGCYDSTYCGGLVKTDKTRKVNVITYKDEYWRVAVNLPEIARNVVTMSPAQGMALAAILLGEKAYPYEWAVKELATYIRRNVADDLIAEVARQIKNMAKMAEFSQAMADKGRATDLTHVKDVYL